MSNVEHPWLGPFVGSFLGFMFAFLLYLIKENRDKNKRLQSFLIQFDLILDGLQTRLHEDPRLAHWVKIESLFSFSDILSERMCPRDDIKAVIEIYGQWTRYFFLAGVKMDQVSSARESLLNIQTRVRYLIQSMQIP